MKIRKVLILITSLMLSGLVYAQEQGGGRIVDLPEPQLAGTITLEAVIQNRRSIRQYKDWPIKINEVSQLCWAAQGVTDPEKGYRAAPSSGATYPLELYVVMKNGVYRYEAKTHRLHLQIEKDFREAVAKQSWRQMWMAKASVVFVLTAVYERTTRRYGERGIQYVHLEAGHVAQNIHLQAVAMSMGSCPVGAFKPEAIRKLLQISKNEEVVYIIPVGR